MQLIVDLEGTCCNDDSILESERETIEIGAVVVSKGRTLGEFSTLVHPARHSTLTEFCSELTGIRQSDVDRAPGFIPAYHSFCTWAELYLGVAFEMYCWGHYDFRQLGRDCHYHCITMLPLYKYVDLSTLFTKRYGKKRGHRGAMKYLGIEASGSHHRGLDDARNIAKILPYL